MKKTLLLLFFTLSFGFCIGANEVQYHFQEGFAKGIPSGWKGNGKSASASHITDPPFSFAQTNSSRFDNNYEDGYRYLETPSYSDAGTLSFYIARAVAATQMDFVVYKIIGTDTTEIDRIDAQKVSHSSKGWDYISVKVNVQEAVSFRFVAEGKNNVAGTVYVDDMELTKYSDSIDEPDDESIAKIVTNFGDGSWGELASGNPSSGTYTDSEINGFKLTKAVVVKASANCPTGLKHTNRIAIDKKSAEGSIEFPLLKDIGELEIHAQSGSPSSFKLQEYVSGSWYDIDTYNTIRENDSVYVIALNKTTPTKLRIANNHSSVLLIYQITTTTYQENQELNLTGSTPAEGGTCYYNLTNQVTLKFNKELVMGSGDILLNDTPIALSMCVINGKEVVVPVTLEGSPNYKSYKMIIPQGAFLEKNNTSNLSNLATINFKTSKTISYPTNYASDIDVVYFNANTEMNRLDIYYPTSAAKPVPLLINIHGGGWNHGEKEAQSGFNSLFNNGIAVANIEYRMTPQATAPAAVVDARNAMMYLLENADKYNIDVNRIVFQGSSAGAHLALTAGYLQNDNRYDTGSNYSGEYKIVAVVDKYGPANVEKFLHYKSLVNWLGEYSTDVNFMRTVSPVHLVDIASTPATYIVHGDADAIVEYEQSEFLVEALDAAGVDYEFTTIPGGGHGGFTSEEYAQMDTEITAFLNRILFKNSVGVENDLIDRKYPIVVNGNNISVNVEDDAAIEVFDVSGKCLIQSNTKQINIEQSGFFIIKVRTSKEESSYKIVK